MSGENNLFDWNGEERRRSSRPSECPYPECPPLTDSEIESIAEKAADKAVAKITSHVYQEVGRGVINKLTWIIGALAVGMYIWAQSKGLLK